MLYIRVGLLPIVINTYRLRVNKDTDKGSPSPSSTTDKESSFPFMSFSVVSKPLNSSTLCIPLLYET